MNLKAFELRVAFAVLLVNKLCATCTSLLVNKLCLLVQ